MSIPRGVPHCLGVAALSQPSGGPGRAPRWEAAAAEVISCAWPRAARRARCGHSGRGAAVSAGAGFVRSSGDLPGFDRGPPRPPRPLLRGGGDPAASRHSRRASAGQRRAWRPGSRRDSRQLTQVSRAGREGRGCAAGRGRSAGRTGLTGGGEGNSGAGASLPGSRGTGADSRTGRR